MTEVHNLIANIKISFASQFFLLLIVCFSCSDDTEQALSLEAKEKLALMEEMVGTYEVEGRYGADLFALQTVITLSEVSEQELEISGTGFPPFKIMNWYRSYNNPDNPEEYKISADPVEPNEGIVYFSFPENKVGIAVKIQENETRKKDLILSGIKR